MTQQARKVWMKKTECQTFPHVNGFCHSDWEHFYMGWKAAKELVPKDYDEEGT